MMRTSGGFTLFELLIVITIAALLLGIGVPSFTDFLARHSADATARTVWHTLAKTRETAVISGESAIFCGLNEDDACVRDNIRTLAVFHDYDENRQLDDDEMVISRIDLNYAGRIRLRASNARFIGYANDGYAHPWGSIILCHASGKPELIRRVTVNRAGRNYLARDRNGDGVVAAYDGAAIEC